MTTIAVIILAILAVVVFGMVIYAIVWDDLWR